MAKKKHKYSKSHVDITTKLSAARVLEIGSGLADSISWLHRADLSDGVAQFHVGVIGGRVEWMTFNLQAAAEGKVTHATTHLEHYLTTRTKLFLIPITPKRMQGYKTYRRFMRELASAVQSEDPTSTATITERPIA